MKTRRFPSILLAAVIAVGIASPPGAIAQERTRLEFVSLPVGALANLVTSSLAGMVSKKTSYSAIISPYAGPQVFIPLLDRGEGAFAIINVGDSKQAYNGEKPAYDRAHRNLRLVAIGHENTLAPLVLASACLRSLAMSCP